MTALIRSGVHDGYAWTRLAISPETTPAAIDVPPTRKYFPSTTQVGQRVAYSEPGASVDTRRAPGATTSGFSTPSWVLPRLDQAASSSSPMAFVPASSTAPTVMTCGSFAGA